MLLNCVPNRKYFTSPWAFIINHASLDIIIINTLSISVLLLVLHREFSLHEFWMTIRFRYDTRPITAPDLALSLDQPITLRVSLARDGRRPRELRTSRAVFLLFSCAKRASGVPNHDFVTIPVAIYRRGRSPSIRVRRIRASSRLYAGIVSVVWS